MQKTLVSVLVLVAAGYVKAGDFSDGVNDGRYMCEDLFSGDPDDCWDIDRLCIEKLIDGEFAPSRWDNPSEKSYKKGGRKGVKEAIREIEKSCFHEDVSTCNDLGENAAEQIAYDLCGYKASWGGKKPNYENRCRKEAFSVCKGNIAGKFYDFCPEQSLNADELHEGKSKCKQTVNDLLGWKLRH